MKPVGNPPANLARKWRKLGNKLWDHSDRLNTKSMYDEAHFWRGCAHVYLSCALDIDELEIGADSLEIALLRTAIEKTLEENKHLADGDDCTLKHLKRAIAKTQ